MRTRTAVEIIATRGTKMKSSIFKTMLTAAVATAPMALLSASQADAQSVTRPAQEIALSIGNGQLVNIPGTMTDVFVANDAVADVQVKSTNQFYVFGKGGGVTTVYASNSRGDVIYSANVRVGANLDSVGSMLSVAMPEAKIGVSTMGSNTFLLTGTVKSPEDAAEAERLVQAYAGKETNVISRLRTATPLQVNLQVRIAEVSRSLVKTLGVNLASVDGTGGTKFVIGQGRAFYPQFTPGGAMGTGTNVVAGGTTVTPTDIGSTVAVAGKLFGLDILGALDAGETVGLVSTLAQPNLTALSGETADFLAGGEFPIPVSQGLGTTSIEYRRYGVSLAYTPTVLANGRISLRVRPEVSELSSQGAIVLNSISVPSLTIRRTETTVELGSGQSFMIAGLLSSNTQNEITKLPGAGDLPILGSLFRSTSFKKGETELVIVVTPYLVNPVNANQIVLPTDGYQAPNELQRLLGNQSSDGVSGDKANPATSNSTSPSVGAADENATKDKKSKPKRTASADDAAKPGFSLK